jgi:hypothetical protein
MAEELIIKPKIITRITHRVIEHVLLQRLERLCEAAGVEFPKEAWPKDDRKAYFLLGVCATEDMKGLSLPERLERLDDWARQRNLLRPNETLFAKKQVKAPQPTVLLKSSRSDTPWSRDWGQIPICPQIRRSNKAHQLNLTD